MTTRSEAQWIAQLGAPAMFTEIPRVDALGTLAQAHLTPPPALSAPVPDPALPLPPAPDAARAGRFRALAACARSEIERLSLQGEAGVLVAILSWWEVRLAALVRLRSPTAIVTEDHHLWSVLSRVALKLSPGEEGSRLLASSALIPFSLRVLHARSPRLAGDLPTALVRVNDLRIWAAEQAAHAATTGAEAGKRVWLDRSRRLSLVLVGLLLESRDPRAALAALDGALTPPLDRREQDPWLLCIAARMHVVLGLVPEAERLCERAETAAAGLSSDTETVVARGEHAQARLGAQIQAVRALVLVARGEAGAARKVLCAASQALGAEAGEPSGPEQQQTGLDVDAQAMQRALQANASTAAFLAGHLGTAAAEAWQLLSDCAGAGAGAGMGMDLDLDLDLSPAARATAGATALVFNTATYAELAADDAGEAKRALLQTVVEHASDGARVSAHKLAP